MRKLMYVAALVVASVCVSQTQASFIIYAQEDGVNGGAITQIGSGPDFTSAVFNGVYGDFALTIFGAASHNNTNLSSLLTAAVSIENLSDEFRTITLYASQNNYTLPVGTPLSVESGLSGTVNTGTLTGTGVFEAFAANSNALLDTTDFSNGAQNVAFTGSTFDTGSATGSFGRTGSNSLYSITSVIVGNISGGGEGNFSSHVNVTAVPVPPTLIMALTGIPFLALGLRRFSRRRTVIA